MQSVDQVPVVDLGAQASDLGLLLLDRLDRILGAAGGEDVRSLRDGIGHAHAGDLTELACRQRID